MEPSGIEPLTSCVQSRRSPSWAKAPQDLSKLNKKLKYIPFFLRKEVIQPHLPIRLPCYDFTPIIAPTLDGRYHRPLAGFGCEWLSWCDGRCVQGPGTYSPQYADLRLLAIPTSCRRVSAYNPNWEMLLGIRSTSRFRFPLFIPL